VVALIDLRAEGIEVLMLPECLLRPCLYGIKIAPYDKITCKSLNVKGAQSCLQD
jgi:hypothetical protein